MVAAARNNPLETHASQEGGSSGGGFGSGTFAAANGKYIALPNSTELALVACPVLAAAPGVFPGIAGYACAPAPPPVIAKATRA